MNSLLVTLSSGEYSINISSLREYAHHTTRRAATLAATSLFILTTIALLLSLREVGFSADALFAGGSLRTLFGLSGLGLFVALSIAYENRHTPESLRNFSKVENAVTNSTWRLIEHMYLASSSEALVLAILSDPISRLTMARAEVAPDSVIELAQTLLTHGELGDKSLLIQQIIQRAFKYADEQGSYQLDSEHLLISLFSIDNSAIQQLNSLLRQAHVSLELLTEIVGWYALAESVHTRSKLLQETSALRPKSSMNRSWTARQTPLIDSVSQDLSLAASYGAIRTLNSYNREISQAIRALESSQRIPLFVGEQGSGIEDIAATIATTLVGDTTQKLHDYRVLQLDLSTVLSSQNPAQLVDTILEEASQAGNVILFFQNVASLVGDTSFEASTVLANAAKSPNLKVVASSNQSDLRRFLQNSSQMQGIFMPIQLHELSKEETLRELMQRTASIEHVHHCVITLPALHKAISLTDTLSSTEPNPGRTLHLLEEAASEASAEGRHFVTAESLTKAVEHLTGIKASTATGDEAEKLLHLESLISQRVIGQPQAVSLVSSALKRARAGLADPNRPLASFLFAGPTGVGKTELAKALASGYIGDEAALLRFDMSEYQTEDALDRLIGNPNDPRPQGGLLTQAIKQAPFRIILFDEIEKAHPGVLDLFLQLLDDARVTENTGQTVRLTNTILIATTNAASREIYARGGNLQTTELNTILEASFRPEFLNRFDAIVPFHPLTGDVLQELVQLEFMKVAKRAESKGITLTISPDALKKLAAIGTDERYGARPLRRTVEQKLENILADLLLTGKAQQGTTIAVTAEMIQ